MVTEATSTTSIQRARKRVEAVGLVKEDNTGDPDVEALFSRIDVVRQGLQALQRAVVNDKIVTKRGVLQRIALLLRYL